MRGSPFFDDVSQTDATVGGEAVKLPVFYYEGSAISAIFPARLKALRDLMPDPRFSPARLAPSLGAVAVTCFEYRDTDIGPYNELAISVPLNEPSFAPNLPGRALITSLRRRQFHTWMDQQPQGSEFKISAIEMGVTAGRGAAELELGTRHPIARELRSLLRSQRPIQYQYLPRFEGILYGPEHLTLPLIKRFGASIGTAESAPVA